MKPNRFFQLLKAEMSGLVMIWFVYGLFILIMNISSGNRPEMFSLSSAPADSFNSVITFMVFFGVFKNVGSGFGTKETFKAASFESLEFFFTRAISRRSLFYAKASLYLFICLTPLAVALIYSYAKPEIKLAYYNSSLHVKATEQFYLTHFSGAHREKDIKDEEGDRFYVVLPTGRIHKAFFSFVLGCIAVMSYQMASFLLWSKRWGQWLVWFAWLSLPFVTLRLFVARNSFDTPSGYESSLVWVNQHPVIVLMGVGLLFIITQTYSCQRFVKTEVL